MATNQELAVTTFDPDAMKSSLIAFLQSIDGFEDINYAGSAAVALIDLLVRNATYTSFQANMVGNESFIESAQIRANVSAHAQKLSYLPRSCVSSRAVVDLVVKPAVVGLTNYSISSDAGLSFFTSIGGNTYTFVTKDEIPFVYVPGANTFNATGVTIYQGQYIDTNQYYTGTPITIQNPNVDTDTLRVVVSTGTTLKEFVLANSLTDVGADQNVYFLREASSGLYEISFGTNVLGVEPALNSNIEISYVNCVDAGSAANGASSFVAAGSVGGYSNIVVTTTQIAAMGADRDSIDDIRFLAPKIYQAQNRALAPVDYEAIVKQDFPFIRNVKAWGGEENNPPMYGKTMISMVLDEGYNLTTSLKNQIISALRLKGVGSVTPYIVEPDIFELNLSIGYKVKSGVTDVSDVEAFLSTQTQAYSDQYLLNFNSYYNEYELTQFFTSNISLETVSITKTAVATRDAIPGATTSYSVIFNNELTPGSIVLTGIVIDASASSETIADDDAGNLVYTKTLNGNSTKSNIGTVDYETGDCEFVLTPTSGTTITITATPVKDNFYVSTNQIVEIGTATPYQITD